MRQRCLCNLCLASGAAAAAAAAEREAALKKTAEEEEAAAEEKLKHMNAVSTFRFACILWPGFGCNVTGRSFLLLEVHPLLHACPLCL